MQLTGLYEVGPLPYSGFITRHLRNNCHVSLTCVAAKRRAAFNVFFFVLFFYVNADNSPSQNHFLHADLSRNSQYFLLMFSVGRSRFLLMSQKLWLVPQLAKDTLDEIFPRWISEITFLSKTLLGLSKIPACVCCKQQGLVCLG